MNEEFSLTLRVSFTWYSSYNLMRKQKKYFWRNSLSWFQWKWAYEKRFVWKKLGREIRVVSGIIFRYFCNQNLLRAKWDVILLIKLNWAVVMNVVRIDILFILNLTEFNPKSMILKKRLKIMILILIQVLNASVPLNGFKVVASLPRR